MIAFLLVCGLVAAFAASSGVMLRRFFAGLSLPKTVVLSGVLGAAIPMTIGLAAVLVLAAPTREIVGGFLFMTVLLAMTIGMPASWFFLRRR